MSPAEMARRGVGSLDGRLRSLPILALSVHSACNCRCIMCDIWTANAEKREIAVADLERHLDAIRRLHVQRVMLTGGEPLLHRNLWTLCRRLRQHGIRVTLVTTGLLVEAHAAAIAETIDEIVISIDGAREVHDAIRRVPGGFDRIARGVAALAACARRPRTTARSVVQRANHASLAATVRAVEDLGIDRLSFLAADVTSTAFNRPEPWSDARRAEIAIGPGELPALDAAILEVASTCQAALARGFIAGGLDSLGRIRAYYRALAGAGAYPRVRCNAPWISAVLEPGDRLRPCFFHPAYASAKGRPLDDALNATDARAFRRSLDVETNETCRRCVCSIALPVWAEA